MVRTARLAVYCIYFLKKKVFVIVFSFSLCLCLKLAGRRGVGIVFQTNDTIDGRIYPKKKREREMGEGIGAIR